VEMETVSPEGIAQEFALTEHEAQPSEKIRR
jgi:hypothetical protein